MSDTAATDTPAPDPGFDTGHFRTVMGHFPTGVTVVTGMADGEPVGFTIGSFTSVSLDPPLVGFLPQVGSSTWDAMATGGSFCVNVLAEEQADLCWKFAKSGTDDTRFIGVDWRPAPSGAPILERAVAWIDCSIEEVHTMGDHYFVLGRVTSLDADADHNGQPPQPMIFFKGAVGGFAG